VRCGFGEAPAPSIASAGVDPVDRRVPRRTTVRKTDAGNGPGLATEPATHSGSSSLAESRPEPGRGTQEVMRRLAFLFDTATCCSDPPRLLAFRDAIQAARERFMHDRGCELRRIPVPRTWVHNGARSGNDRAWKHTGFFLITERTPSEQH
jgi:hypothetical protein